MMSRVVLALSCRTISLLCQSGVPVITVFVPKGVTMVRVIACSKYGIKLVILGWQ
jgi:hypothetical protein